jgi:hypothetical protein
MPTKVLPSSPNLDHLKAQAKDLIKSRLVHELEACQRIREFHPRFKKSPDEEIGDAKFTLTDAQLTIAREYGFASWARIKAHVETPVRNKLDLPIQERIQDPLFRRAVDMLDAGDENGLRDLLLEHPELVHQRVLLEGGNYFRNPSLLEFCAENPIRHGKLPENIVQVAKVILDAGARLDRASVNQTLELICSGCVPRECDVQTELIELLCDYGGDADGAVKAGLGHGEFGAVQTLLRRGAKVDVPTSAALGNTDDAARLISSANADDRHLALAYAAQYGHAQIVRLLLDAGEDPNRYNPVGAHSHSTPLHQAAFYGHLDVVQLLVEHGARLDITDILFHGTPLGWAEHGGKVEIVSYLRSV